ncbi:MAG: hypothetical protein Q4G30_01920 [Actinomycetaceae bacterium]|nr:hypothetical protein [Actinomycetaceae bacterium]
MLGKGPYPRSALRQLDDKRLGELLAQGRLIRVAHGWYAQPTTPLAATRAVKLGGRLGCLSACKEYGLWVPPHSDLHVLLIPGANTPHTSGVQFHRIAHPCMTAVASLEASITQVFHRHGAENGLVVLESAVNQRKLSLADANYILSTIPLPAKRGIKHFNPKAHSGSETRLRLFFQRRNIPVEPQAPIAGVGHVDLLVGRSWILEADSALFHSSVKDVARDCERDLIARQQGYIPDRLSYQQIWVQWEQTIRWLEAMVKTRRHLRAPKPL